MPKAQLDKARKKKELASDFAVEIEFGEVNEAVDRASMHEQVLASGVTPADEDADDDDDDDEKANEAKGSGAARGGPVAVEIV